jgi:argininosuccinate lyase
VALDIRLYLRDEAAALREALLALVETIEQKAEENTDAILPATPIMQRAPPITLAHHLLAYAGMFLRDIGRLDDATARMNRSPLGSGALAGTTYPLDRGLTASLLGFDGVVENSLDGVSTATSALSWPPRFR